MSNHTFCDLQRPARDAANTFDQPKTSLLSLNGYLTFKRFTMRHLNDWLNNTSVGPGNVFRAALTAFLPDLPTPNFPTLFSLFVPIVSFCSN